MLYPWTSISAHPEAALGWREGCVMIVATTATTVFPQLVYAACIRDAEIPSTKDNLALLLDSTFLLLLFSLPPSLFLPGHGMFAVLGYLTCLQAQSPS